MLAVGGRRGAMGAGARRPWDRLAGGGLLGSGAFFLVSTTIVNAGNYVFNLILGRWLGPAAFADLSLLITLTLLVTFIATTLQMAVTKFVAGYTASDPALIGGLRRWLGRWAWGLGGGLLALFALGAPLWQRIFHTASPWPFVILGLGMPIYLAQSVDRGVLQGQVRFGRLAASYQAEMVVRLAGALLFVALGWSVSGAVLGLTIAFGATWLVARAAGEGAGDAPLPASDRRAVLAFVGPTCAALLGQILINNSDILIVKHFFAAEPAGQYAALALIGRIVFFATWSIVAVLFPIVARRAQDGEDHRQLLGLGLAAVGAISAAIVGASALVPGLIVRLLFGGGYLAVAPLLWLYAAATALYAAANVIATYHLSLGDRWSSALVILGGVAQVGALWLRHGDLREVVMVQLWVMLALLAALLAWDRWRVVAGRRSAHTPAALSSLIAPTRAPVPGPQGSEAPPPRPE